LESRERVASVNARRWSIRSQLHACGKLSLASRVVFALAPLLAVGADGGAPALFANAPYSVMLADGGAPAVLALAPLSVMLADEGVVNIRAFFFSFSPSLWSAKNNRTGLSTTF
jgi:hypothetical protein